MEGGGQEIKRIPHALVEEVETCRWGKDRNRGYEAPGVAMTHGPHAPAQGQGTW
jgi:hypothetical protein